MPAEVEPRAGTFQNEKVLGIDFLPLSAGQTDTDNHDNTEINCAIKIVIVFDGVEGKTDKGPSGAKAGQNRENSKH